MHLYLLILHSYYIYRVIYLFLHFWFIIHWFLTWYPPGSHCYIWRQYHCYICTINRDITIPTHILHSFCNIIFIFVALLDIPFGKDRSHGNTLHRMLWISIMRFWYKNNTKKYFSYSTPRQKLVLWFLKMNELVRKRPTQRTLFAFC